MEIRSTMRSFLVKDKSSSTCSAGQENEDFENEMNKETLLDRS